MSKLLCKIGVHKYTWTQATRDWFFTGIKDGWIGSECVRCGQESERL